MKKLLRITVIALISLLSMQSRAQSFGLKGGVSLANMLIENDDSTPSNDFKMSPGFHVGAVVDVPINSILSFEPGLLFSQKGFRIKESEGDYDVTFKTNLYYLDIPLNFKLSSDLGNGMKLFMTAGPYIGFGITGNMKLKVEYQGDQETDEASVDWGSNDHDFLRRPDLGLTFGGGFEINSFLIGVSYDLGLSNNAANQSNGAIMKNRVLKISFGYIF